MQKVNVKIVDETVKNKVYYALMEFSVEERRSYCVVVNGLELDIEGAGNDIEKATKIFNMISAEEVSSVNLDEVIRDMRIEFFI